MNAALLLSLLTGCAEEFGGNAPFDGPYHSAVLEDGGPYESAVGFVANTRSGTIVPLDLKHGTLLSDSISAPFMLPRVIATGDERQLGEIAVWAPTETTITVFASDLTNGVLLSAPYIIGMGAAPEVVTPTATEPEFFDEDGSGDTAAITDLELRAGATTTESWDITFDGELWWAVGSRSGRQNSPIKPNVTFQTDNHELEFTITGSATLGDAIRFTTDNQIVEHNLGGTPMAMVQLPESSLLVVSVWDGNTEMGWLSLFDMAASAESGRIDLPAGSQPWSLDVASDGVIYVGDSALPSLYIVDIDAEAASGSIRETLTTDGPLTDVVWVSDDETFSNLFVAPALTNRVDVYDLLTGEWKDVNPFDADLSGLDLRSPVIGMAATPEPIGLQDLTDFGARIDKHVVVLTTLNGAVTMLEADTGCRATNLEGPYAYQDTLNEYEFTNVGTASNPTLYEDDATGSAVATPSCGGILQSESWTLVYDGTQGSWIVEGSLSGEQTERAWEDIRYVSDDGALSFTILAGSLPSTDSDTFSFTTASGLLQIGSLPRPDGSSQVLEIPAPPKVFQYRSGRTGGGWDEVQERTYILQPVLNSNVVMRIRTDTWIVEANWD
ncbi:MAG: hypothetical protein P8R54_02355 [Myxococcota bacterium]|nr:hypothetical protein [Myxococcota bacterium]